MGEAKTHQFASRLVLFRNLNVLLIVLKINLYIHYFQEGV